MKSIPLDIAKAHKICLHIMKQRKMPMLYGPPGFGKSSIAKAIANDMNLLFVDLRVAGMDPVDFSGLIGYNAERTRAGYLPLDELPLEGDELPINEATGKPYRGWLVLLDEYTSGAEDTKAATYKFILDRKVGKRNLHKKVFLMGAGNREEDGAIASALGTAIGSRVVNLTIKENLEFWIHKFAPKLDPRVVSFLQFDISAFNTFDPENDEYTHGCARTWYDLSDLIKPLSNEEIAPESSSSDWLPMITGTVGVLVGQSFLTFLTYFSKVVTIEQIKADPKGARVPVGEPGWLYALTGVIAKGTNDQNIDHVMVYLERMPPAFQIIAMRGVIANSPELATHQLVDTWVDAHADEFIQEF